jgi:hypothetical protein
MLTATAAMWVSQERQLCCATSHKSALLRVSIDGYLPSERCSRLNTDADGVYTG